MEIGQEYQFDPKQYYNIEQDQQTQDFIMQQTMIRIKDPKISLDFYTKILGFSLLAYRDFPQMNFSIYMLNFCKKEMIPKDEKELWNFTMKQGGCIELAWNYGSEKNENRVYNTGNQDNVGCQDGKNVNGGFGHIGISVPDVYSACQRFKELGVEFTKSPNSGSIKGIAFIKDPDGYLIEVLPQGQIVTQPVDSHGVLLQ